MDKRRPRF